MLAATVSLEVPQNGELPHSHDDGPVEAPENMSVTTGLTQDAVSGANERIDTTEFTFSPEAVNSKQIAGEGRAHIYVDGEKVGRAYMLDIYLGLKLCEHQIRVSLQTRLHAVYGDADRQPIEAGATVPAPQGSRSPRWQRSTLTVLFTSS